MKPWLTRFFAAIGIVTMLAAVPVACLSREQASASDRAIDQGKKAIEAALAVTGNGAANPLVEAGAGVAKWIVGLMTVGGAATGAAVVQHKHAGLPYTERRARLQDENASYDDLLAHVQQALPQLQAAATAAGDARAVQQAARVQAVLQALNPPVVAPAGSV